MCRKTLLCLLTLLISMFLVSATSHAAPFAYISNQVSNSVSVIDMATNTVATTIPLGAGAGPYGLAVNPAGTRVYVANKDANTVSVIDTGTNTVTATVPVGTSPVRIAVHPSGSPVYVVNDGSNNVSVIDATNMVTTTIPVGSAPMGIQVNPAGTKAYVANYSGNTISVINTATNAVTTINLTGTAPLDLAFTPGGAKAYVSNFESNNVSVINTATETEITKIDAQTHPVGVWANPDGTRVFVANYGSNITMIDPSTDSSPGVIMDNRNPVSIEGNPDGSLLYVVNQGNNVVAVMNPANSYGLVAQIPVGSSPLSYGGRFIASPPAATNGLVSFWRGEGNALDVIGNHHGALHGDAKYAAGRSWQAFSFDGSGDYVSFPDSDDWAFGGNDFSISLWVRFNALADGYTALLDQHYPSRSWSVFYYSDGSLGFAHTPGSTEVRRPWTPQLNTWYNIAVVRNGNALRLYVNGVQAGADEDMTGVTIDNSTEDLWMGCAHTGGGPGLCVNGLMDDVLVYNRALSPVEVLKLAAVMPDTTPDAFTFIDQLGVPLSSDITSNTVTVSGINTQSPITVWSQNGQGCSYRNVTTGGTWTADPGNVNNGDQIQVRNTSSANYSTQTDCLLTIGGVWDNFSVTTAAAGDPNASGLVAWWKGENNAYDSIGGNHGAAQGATTYAAGHAGQAFSFSSATHDGVTAPSSASLNPTEAITMSAWIKPAATSNPWPYIIGKRLDDSGNIQYSITVSDRNTFTCDITGAGVHAEGGAIPLNEWSHVACTYDRNTLRLYVNGEQVASASGSSAIATSSRPLTIGKLEGYDTRNFDGQIDEVKIYSRALTATEVAKDYGLVSWWRAENDAVDSIGGNNGVWNGTTAYAAGQIGQAFSFDGGANSVIVPDSPALRLSTAFTMSAWVNPSAISSDAPNGIISKVGGESGNNGYQMGLYHYRGKNSVFYCSFNAPGEPWGANDVEGGNLPLAQWTFVSCTYDGSYLKVYINGVESGSKYIGSKTVAGSPASLRISGDDNNTVWFNGLIDEVKIYSHAQSAVEVANSYGLVSWWRGENNANDSIGGNNGTLQGGTTFVAGKSGQAFSFDGIDDFVSIPPTAGIIDNGPGTIELWFKANAVPSGHLKYGYLYVQGNTANGADLRIYLYGDGTINFVGNDGTNYDFNISIPFTDTASWHHVAGVWSATDTRFYLDGVLIGTDSSINMGSFIPNEITIGSGRFDNSYFNGLIDEVRIYHRTLSGVEVSEDAGAYPEPFAFASQTGIATGAVVESNAITVSGIANPAPISITACTGASCEFQINSGGWTSTTGTVNAGDTVRVRQTSTSSYSAMTTATLNIGGREGTFSITTVPDLVLNPVISPTNLASQSIGGTVKSGATVTVSLNGGPVHAADVTGAAWSYNVTDLVRGGNNITVSATDTGYSPTKSATISCVAPRLTVAMNLTSGISGTAGGTVTTTPSGISCLGGSCSSLFNGSALVTLMATPDGNSIFGGWSGDLVSQERQHDITMGNDSSSGDRGVTATFTYVEPAKVQSTGAVYQHIRDAYSALAGDDTILARQFLFTGDFTLDKTYSIILKGGYDPAYSVNSGYSTIQGQLAVGKGSLTVEMVVVK